MTIDSKLKAVIDRFDFPGQLTDCREVRTGHINITCRLRFRQADGTARDYVLQRINNYVFKKPWEVMENVQRVTEHLRAAMVGQGLDPENRVLRLVPVKGGGTMAEDGEGGFWRAYDFIRHATTVDKVEGPAQFRQIGAAFGAFQSMLSDFPIALASSFLTRPPNSFVGRIQLKILRIKRMRWKLKKWMKMKIKLSL